MVSLTHISENDVFQSIENIEKHITSVSISNFKTNIPRVNFRRIKLNKFQNLYSTFKSKKVTRLYLDEKLLEVNLPIRKIKLKTASSEISINPLRKKKIEDEKPPLIKEVEEKESEDLLLGEKALTQEFLIQPKSPEIVNDITFNLEAQIVQEDENILLSPTVPSAPTTKDDLVSSSGKQAAFIWPPLTEKKVTKKPKHKGLKKKPYFLSDKDKSPEKLERAKPIEQGRSEALNFPWTLTKDDTPPIEEIFSGGLESELLDIPSQKVEKEETKPEQLQEKPKEIIREEVKNIPFTEKVVYKALLPEILFEPIPEIMINDSLKNIGLFSKLLDKFNNLEFGIVVTGQGERKTGKMFENFTHKLTPVRIIILGGALATIGYSIWNYLLPIINSDYRKQVNNKIVVRNLFKTKNVSIPKGVLTDDKGNKVLLPEESEEKTLSPITEEERQSLIHMAQESLENRIDPFGQESVLPQEVIQQKIDEQKEPTPREIPFNKKQVELVGIISANNKNLALVNVYNADYTVMEHDDKSIRDSKLKTALSMAVPNRLEVSLLDPVDEWYVKQIIKGKAMGDEDPFIELVKGDKKFKLKVGQKVLLPEEKQPDELKEESKTEAQDETGTD